LPILPVLNCHILIAPAPYPQFFNNARVLNFADRDGWQWTPELFNPVNLRRHDWDAITNCIVSLELGSGIRTTIIPGSQQSAYMNKPWPNLSHNCPLKLWDKIWTDDFQEKGATIRGLQRKRTRDVQLKGVIHAFTAIAQIIFVLSGLWRCGERGPRLHEQTLAKSIAQLSSQAVGQNLDRRPSRIA
jgi:hexosaminidase